LSFDITIPAQSVTVPSQVVSVPAAQIVYQNSWLSQTSAISLTTIFSPSGEGLFRVSGAIFAYGSGTCGASAEMTIPGQGGMSFQSTYNPGNSPAQVNIAASDIYAGNSGDSVTLETSIGGSITYYDLYVTIEQLQ
jgi:hypothetical protein